MDSFILCSFVNETQRMYGRHIRSRNQGVHSSNGPVVLAVNLMVVVTHGT